MLQVQGASILDDQHRPIQLRGVCVGGWMNMEDFMAGFPGSEHLIRRKLAQRHGAAKAEFLFERWLDYFFTEEDVRFIRACGANVIRVALNYRHFESDEAPFHYSQRGFARLAQAVDWCARHGLYVILDLHAVQGWQNGDWHSDNSGRSALLWEHPHFQDRFVALWEELARCFVGNPTVAGYDLMNEPVTNCPAGRFSLDHPADFAALNCLYARTVAAIRRIDPQHIIFLEGDGLAQRFAGLEAPFADNLVYSSHPYSEACFLTGPYPGPLGKGQAHFDLEQQRAMLLRHEGTAFAQQHKVPLWLGEFGILFGLDPADHPHRIRALDDQIQIAEDLGAHWTTWNYKDIGKMGWVALDSESPYMRLIAPILEAKQHLMTDSASSSILQTPVYRHLEDFARTIEPLLPPAAASTRRELECFLHQTLMNVHLNHHLQPAYVELFEGLSGAQLEHVLQSFALEQCRPRAAFLQMLRRRLHAPGEPTAAQRT